MHTRHKTSRVPAKRSFTKAAYALIPAPLFGVTDASADKDSNFFRKGMSKTPELTSSKAKLNVITVYAPRLKASGSVTVDGDDGYDPDHPTAWGAGDGNLAACRRLSLNSPSHRSDHKKTRRSGVSCLDRNGRCHNRHR